MDGYNEEKILLS